MAKQYSELNLVFQEISSLRAKVADGIRQMGALIHLREPQETAEMIQELHMKSTAIGLR